MGRGGVALRYSGHAKAGLPGPRSVKVAMRHPRWQLKLGVMGLLMIAASACGSDQAEDDLASTTVAPNPPATDPPTTTIEIVDTCTPAIQEGLDAFDLLFDRIDVDPIGFIELRNVPEELVIYNAGLWP